MSRPKLYSLLKGPMDWTIYRICMTERSRDLADLARHLRNANMHVAEYNKHKSRNPDMALLYRLMLKHELIFVRDLQRSIRRSVAFFERQGGRQVKFE